MLASKHWYSTGDGTSPKTGTSTNLSTGTGINPSISTDTSHGVLDQALELLLSIYIY